MSREVWREFICSPDRAWRHMSFIGQGVTGRHSDAIDQAALEEFLLKLKGADEDVDLLSDVVDLLTGDYAGFMRNTLPNLTEVMSNEVTCERTIVGPGLRGNPLWGSTIVGRYSGTIPPTHFVSRIARRSHDLPENRLLKWLAADVAAAVSRISRRVGPMSLHAELAAMSSACRTALMHDSLAGVLLPDVLAPDLEAAGRHHQRPEYRKAWALARRRADIARNDDHEVWWNNVLSLLAVGWLEPMDDDRLFELYVLAMVIAVITEECGFGEPEEIGLVTSGRRHVAHFTRRDVSIKLYFNQAPAAVLRENTKYGVTVASYDGVTGSPRRPDVTLVVDRGGSRRLVIIEAKETGDRDYISDSVYKVFGYLYDFADVFIGERGVRAVLLVPDGISAAASAPTNVLRLASAQRREDVARSVVEAID